MKNSLFLTLLFSTLVINVQAFDFESNPENDKYAAEGLLLPADFDRSEVIPVVQGFWSALYSTASSTVTRIGQITSSENYKHKPKPQPQKEALPVVTPKPKEVPSAVISPAGIPTEPSNPSEPKIEVKEVESPQEPVIAEKSQIQRTSEEATRKDIIPNTDDKQLHQQEPALALVNVPFTNVHISRNSAIIGGIAVVAAVGLTYILHKKGYLQKLYNKIKEQPAMAAGVASALIGGAVAASYCYSC